MAVADSISIAYSLEQDDIAWQQAVTRVLDRLHRDNPKTRTLRSHFETATKLRHTIRTLERHIRLDFPSTPRAHTTTPQEALRIVMSGVEYDCRKPQHATPSTTEVWEGLYAGTWSILDRYEEHGRRYFFLCKTDAGELDPLRLTPLQGSTLYCLSRGLGDAEIAMSLGIKLYAASALVRTVKKKLRIPFRRDLIGLNERCLRMAQLEIGDLACALLYSTTALASVIPDSISDAERDILHLQIAGKSNSEIAQIRQVAYKTISNQVATAYSKLNVRTCGEMVHNLRAACR